MTKHFDYLVCEKWHKDFSFWWHWCVHWHKYLLLRDELKIFCKLQAFAGNPLCAVCTNCFEKCTYFFANIKDDSRNAPKRLRKTVKRILLFSRLHLFNQIYRKNSNIAKSINLFRKADFFQSHDSLQINLICWYVLKKHFLKHWLTFASINLIVR